MTLARRMTTGIILLLVLTVLLLVAQTEQSLREGLREDILLTLTREAGFVSTALREDSAGWNESVRTLARISGNRVTLIAADGRVIADSDIPPDQLPLLENHGNRPEVRAALAGDTGRSVRFSSSVGRELLYVAVPGGPGVIRVAEDERRVDAVIDRARRPLFVAAAMALLVGALGTWLMARSLAQPIVALAGSAAAIARGAPPRFPRSGIRELDRLVDALRDMHGQLELRFADLRAERTESSALVEAMIEGVISADPRGRITTANHAAHSLLGYDDNDTLPDVSTLFHGKEARAVVAAAREHRAERSATIDLDGRTVLLTARGLPDGAVILVLHDLTEMRRLEAVRRDFVANVSHELKTPLTSISGYAETLLSERVDHDTAQRFQSIILANARRMHRLVDDLLDLSRIESGRWQPRPEQLVPAIIAREAVAMAEERATMGRVALTVDIPEDATLFADPDALRQILGNLVDNALRYTPAGGRVTIGLQHGSDGDALTVTDTGSGIGSDHLPRIFERFYRVDASRSREEGGTGLGLSIVRHLVESHGGEVSAESELGRGTTVRMWFPRA